MAENLTETKPWYFSTGVIGAISAILAGVAGIWYTDVNSGQIEILLTSLSSLVAGIIALIGRVKATKKIG